MDWPAQTQAVAALLSLGATVIGFGFVVRQLKLVERSMRSEANGRLSEQSIAIISFVADRPHLYDYFYASKPLAAQDEHRVAVLSVCEMIANYADLVVCTLPDLAPPVRQRWIRFITDTTASSPALREFITRYRLWYSDELLDLI